MDDIETARRILADPCGLMLPGNLGKALLDELDAATTILESLRYERCPGVARWKPPLGPKPDLSIADELRAKVAELTGTLAAYRKAWAAMLPNPGRWPETAERIGHICDAYAIENQRLRDEIAALKATDDSTKPALDRALDRLGFALEKSRNAE